MHAKGLREVKQAQGAQHHGSSLGGAHHGAQAGSDSSLGKEGLVQDGTPISEAYTQQPKELQTVAESDGQKEVQKVKAQRKRAAKAAKKRKVTQTTQEVTAARSRAWWSSRPCWQRGAVLAELGVVPEGRGGGDRVLEAGRRQH